MFFISLTKNRLTNKIKTGHVKDVSTDLGYITVVTDGLLSKVDVQDQSITLLETPFLHTEHEHTEYFVKARFDLSAKVLNFDKKINSGRAIYYTTNDRGEVFVSTHIHLLREAGIVIEENSHAVPEFLVFSSVVAPYTLYRNIYQLVSGSNVDFEILPGHVQIQTRHFSFPKSQDQSYVSTVLKSDRLLDNKLNLLADNPQDVAVLMSGGLDSSALAQYMKNKFQNKETYSTSYPFENPEVDHERQYALSAAEMMKLDHKHHEISTEEYLESVIEAIAINEGPIFALQSGLLSSIFKTGLPKEK